MNELIEFFTIKYNWPVSKAREMAEWMSKIQEGGNLDRKRSIAADFEQWRQQQSR